MSVGRKTTSESQLPNAGDSRADISVGVDVSPDLKKKDDRFRAGRRNANLLAFFDDRRTNSLPHHYKVQTSSPAMSRSTNHPVRALEFTRRLRLMREWLSEFDDHQRTVALQSLLPFFGASQLHHLSNQLPDGDLHALCQPDCGDFLRHLPSHVTRNILSFLEPQSLVQASRVCKNWNDMISNHSEWIWRKLCFLPQWRLSTMATQEQLNRHSAASDDNTIDWKLIFIERYKLKRSWLKGRCHVRTFEGHSEGISCVQFDGTRIVSGSHDKTIRVWNVKTNSKWSVLTLTGHSGEVRCLHLECGGNRLVSGSTDATIKVWDLDIQPEWSSIGCRVTMVGHSDTVRCVHMSSKKGIVISGSYDQTVRLWCLKTGQCTATLRGHAGHVVCIHVPETPDKKRRQSRCSRSSSRSSASSMNCSSSDDSDGGEHYDGDPQILISGSSDMTIKVWCLKTFTNMKTLSGHKDAVTCLSLTREHSHRIISGSLDRTIKMWDLSSGNCLSTLDWMSSEGHTGVVRCLQTDAWRIVSAADDKTIKVWGLNSGQRLVTLKSHSDGVTCLQFNDFFIVSGSYDKTVKLWDFTVC